MTPQKIERELIQTSSKIFPFYYGNQDSLEFYSSAFTKKIIGYINKYPSTLAYPFQTIIDSNVCNITTSPDGLFRIYSWDTWLGGSMRFFNNIFQYKSGNTVYSKTFDLEEDYPSVFFSKIYTLKANNKTYYLAIGNGIYSNKDAGQSIKVFTIQNNRLNDTIKLIKTKSGLVNSIDLEFDFFSVADRPERPVKLIKYDANKKIIYIPIVYEDGKVTGRFILYQFKGQYFEHILTQKKSSN
ncbi:MAG TPA: hypothetical protein VGQ09_02635 [Chitinophagaceae bacterium]|jgi:hypothetical protein|nr:hypothetical protein [Chitinophagaceae bacterium]